MEQQEYIQSKTPNLPIIFTTVSFYDNKNTNESLCPPTELSNGFSNGYKNMCYFWSIDFLKYLEKYEYIIRIDEDCILEKMDVHTVDEYKKNSCKSFSPNKRTRALL